MRAMEAEQHPRRRGRPPGSGGRELLAIAREAFVGHGFHGTTMDAVAAGARISKQTLYRAYPSKDELYEAVVRDWVDQGHDAMRPHVQALAQAEAVRAGLLRFAGVLQEGILSAPVLQMRTLVAAEAEAFPKVAADYMARSWDRNMRLLAGAFDTLNARRLLAIDDVDLAAEQFVWLAIAAPLNRLSLQGASHPYGERRLRAIAEQAVGTFLSRFGGDESGR